MLQRDYEMRNQRSGARSEEEEQEMEKAKKGELTTSAGNDFSKAVIVTSLMQ